MDWKSIPAAPAYVINRRGQVRNRHTGKRVMPSGRRVILAVDPMALVALLFTEPEQIGEEQPEPEPIETAVAETEPVDTAPADTEPEPEPVETVPAEPEPEPEPTEDEQPESASEPEEWRPCALFGGRLEINRRGEVRRSDTLRAVSHRQKGEGGLPFVKASMANRSVCAMVNVLLEEAFGSGAAAAAGLPVPDMAKSAMVRAAWERKAEEARHTDASTLKRGLPRGTRACHDCGRPTHQYRCEACWRKLRGYGFSGSADGCIG